MELRQQRERRPPRRYRGDGTWSDSSPPPTPGKPSQDNSSNATSARRRDYYSAIPIPPHTPPDTEAEQSLGDESSTDAMAKRQPAKKSPSREQDMNLGFGTDAYTGMPAAFPSLDFGVTPTQGSSDCYSLTMLVSDRANQDEEQLRMSLDLMKSLWDCKAFPEDMEERERQWYSEVKNRVKDVEGSCTIHFSSLYESLRQTIIDSIRDMTTCKDFSQSADYPVRTLLRLNPDTLAWILEENEDFCPTGDEFHLREWKESHPGEPLDPDMPPPFAVVKAIRYLRQERLPGCLLGEWRYPIPDDVEFTHETELAKSAVEALTVNILEETEAEEEESLVVTLRVASKHLARLTKWGAVAFQSLPEEESRPPPPAMPTKPVKKARKNESGGKVQAKGPTVAKAKIMHEVVATPPPPMSESKKRRSPPLESLKEVGESERPSKRPKKNPTAVRKQAAKPRGPPKERKRRIQKSVSISETIPTIESASLVDTVPKDAVEGPPESNLIHHQETIIISDDDDDSDSFEEPVCQAKNFQNQIEGPQLPEPRTDMQEASPFNGNNRKREMNNLARFEKMTEGMFGGLHPSSVAKRKRNDSGMATRAGVSNTSNPPPGETGNSRADKQPESQPAESAYANKKRRMDTSTSSPSAKHRPMNKQDKKTKHTTSATPPIYLLERSTTSISAPIGPIQRPNETTRSQASSNGTPGAKTTSATPRLMKSQLQHQYLASDSRSKTNHTNHVPLHSSMAPPRAKPQLHEQLPPTYMHHNGKFLAQGQAGSPRLPQHMLDNPKQAPQYTRSDLQHTDGGPTSTLSMDMENASQRLERTPYQTSQQFPKSTPQNVVQNHHQRLFEQNQPNNQLYPGQHSLLGLPKINTSEQQRTRPSGIYNQFNQQQPSPVYVARPQYALAPYSPTRSPYAHRQQLARYESSLNTIFHPAQASPTIQSHPSSHHAGNPSPPQFGYMTSNSPVRGIQISTLPPASAQAIVSQQSAASTNNMLTQATPPTYMQPPQDIQQVASPVQSHIAQSQEVHGYHTSPDSMRHASPMPQQTSAYQPSEVGDQILDERK